MKGKQKGNRRGILKLIIVPIDDMNKLGKKIMKKRHKKHLVRLVN